MIDLILKETQLLLQTLEKNGGDSEAKESFNRLWLLCQSVRYLAEAQSIEYQANDSNVLTAADLLAVRSEIVVLEVSIALYNSIEVSNPDHDSKALVSKRIAIELRAARLAANTRNTLQKLYYWLLETHTQLLTSANNSANVNLVPVALLDIDDLN